ncbi:hypothetical protein D6D17_01957, partial [Aureobasidium pullulans]
YDYDSSDDDDEEISSYDATAVEEASKTPANHPSFAKAKEKHRAIIQLLEEPLKETTSTSSNVNKLSSMIEERRECCPMIEIRITVAGGMGNALISEGLLTPTGDSGLSETLVIHEFRRVRPDQTQPFRAEIEYYRGAELEEIMATEFKQAYAAVDPSEDNVSDSEDIDFDDSEKDHDEYGHIQAISNLFCNRPECASVEATKEFLRQAHSENDKAAIARMVRWSEGIIRNYTEKSVGSTVVMESATTADLLQDLRGFTHTTVKKGQDYGCERACWPIVKRITFCLDTPFLNDGIVLVDTPGLNDCDPTRAAMVKKEFARSIFVLIIAQISRAINDDTVLRYLRKGYFSHRIGKVIPVLTHTDSLSQFQGWGNANDVQKDRLQEAEDEVDQLEKELEQLRANKRQKIATSEIPYRVQKEQLLKDRCGIMIRNEYVTETLQNKYRTTTRDVTPLPVFCVSTLVYESHRAGFKKSSVPVLSVADTQIPALRHYLRRATGERPFNIVTFHYENTLPSIISSFEMWCCKAHLNGSERLEAIVTDLKPICSAVVEDFNDMVNNEIKRILDVLILNEQTLNEQSHDVCQGWETISPPKYRNLVKKRGFRLKTKALPGLYWNGDLIKISNPLILARCQSLLDMIINSEINIAIALEEHVNQMSTSVREDRQSTFVKLEPFSHLVDLKKTEMRKTVAESFSSLKAEFEGVIHELISPHPDERDASITSRCMVPIYESTEAIKGKNSNVRKPQHMRRQLRIMGGLWSSVHETARSELQQVLDTHCTELSSSVQASLQEIQNSFINCYQDKEVEPEEERKMRGELTRRVQLAKEILPQMGDDIEKSKENEPKKSRPHRSTTNTPGAE